MNDIITIKPSTEPERYFVENAIDRFNAEQMPPTQASRFVNLNFVAKNQKNEVVGGITTVLYLWGILFINVLWVDKAYRGQKLGSKLIKWAEDEAKKMNCTLVHLDTFDFQAKDFYLKQGYEIFGVLEDCPPGHKRYYLKKKI